VIDSTISGNFSDAGGGIYNGFAPSIANIRNTIIAGNTFLIAGIFPGGPDVGGILNSLGHNLIGDGSGGRGYAATDLVGTSARRINPRLGPLQDNGGPTQTMALLPGSPAIGAGGPSDSEWDQRGPGFARTVNGTTDIGAYEVQPSGAGAAALALHSPEPLHLVPASALSRPSTSIVPLRPAAAAVDRVFASVPSTHRGFDGLPKRHATMAGKLDILQTL
jgi:hypothetical protein